MRRPAALFLGAYVGLLGAFVHRHAWQFHGVDWPWGLLLTITVTYAVVRAAERLTPVGGAWFALGWAFMLLAQQFSPGASYLIASDWLGWSFTIGSLGVIAVGVVGSPRLSP